MKDCQNSIIWDLSPPGWRAENAHTYHKALLTTFRIRKEQPRAPQQPKYNREQIKDPQIQHEFQQILTKQLAEIPQDADIQTKADMFDQITTNVAIQLTEQENKTNNKGTSQKVLITQQVKINEKHIYEKMKKHRKTSL